MSKAVVTGIECQTRGHEVSGQVGLVLRLPAGTTVKPGDVLASDPPNWFAEVFTHLKAARRLFRENDVYDWRVIDGLAQLEYAVIRAIDSHGHFDSCESDAQGEWPETD